MSSARVPITIAPWLTVRDGLQALRFYQEAFGATVVYRLEDPDAGVVARLSVEGAEFWLSDGQLDGSRRESLGGGSVRMILTVADPDKVFARALAAGASEVFPVGRSTAGDWAAWSTRSACTGRLAIPWPLSGPFTSICD